jgi:serine/threonine protein kinase
VVFRDLKPENVLFDAVGHVRLADFGLAKPLDRGSPSLRETVCGTPLYMSPEGVRNHQRALLANGAGAPPPPSHGRGPSDAAAVAPEDEGEDSLLPGFANDWWMLGVLTYELLVGERPFGGAGMESLHQSILTQPLRFPPAGTVAVGPQLSEAGRAFLGAVLEKSPLARLGAESTAEVMRSDHGCALMAPDRPDSCCALRGGHTAISHCHVLSLPRSSISTRTERGNVTLRRPPPPYADTREETWATQVQAHAWFGVQLEDSAPLDWAALEGRELEPLYAPAAR